MEQDQDRTRDGRMSKTQIAHDIRRETDAICGGIGTDFLVQRIIKEAIDEMEAAFERTKAMNDRSERIAVLNGLERICSCILRIAMNSETDTHGPKMIRRAMRLSDLILLDVEERLGRRDREDVDRYWTASRENQERADSLFNSISRLLYSESHEQDRSLHDDEYGRYDIIPLPPRRTILDVLLGRPARIQVKS